MATETYWPRANQGVRVTLTYQSYDIIGNYSTWYWAVEYYQGGSSYGPGNYYQLSGFAVSSSYQFTINFDGWVTLASGTFTKGHAPDGSLAAGTMYVTISSDNVYVGTGTFGVSTGTIPRIPRGPRVKEGGVWRNTVAYIKDAGVWKIAIPYIKDGGTWKIGGG